MKPIIALLTTLALSTGCLAQTIATPITPKTWLTDEQYGSSPYIQTWCIDGYEWVYFSSYRQGSFSQKFKNIGAIATTSVAIPCKHETYKGK